MHTTKNPTSRGKTSVIVYLHSLKRKTHPDTFEMYPCANTDIFSALIQIRYQSFTKVSDTDTYI